MCCGKPKIDEIEKGWWQDLNVQGKVVTFQSEQAALDFLALGIGGVPDNMTPVYAMLNFRREQAEG